GGPRRHRRGAGAGGAGFLAEVLHAQPGLLSLLRMARDTGERPCAVLGLPWGHRKKLSETDAVLEPALASYEARVCSCCGQWAKDAHDPAKAGAWQVHTDFTCYAGAALDRFNRERQQSKLELEPGVRPYVAMQSAGSTGVDEVRQAEERR